ncbi:UbiA prenyltransferase family protein [Aliikangiella maris]|uniref:UbiA prenyltransferase family protein n=2 Tax=Aliikangiella maris TaxID=3162458 RepID=A0ABV2BVX8_9GAMM
MNVSSVLHLIRPHQYVKNFFIFLPLFFGLKITDFSLLIDTFSAFIAFCLVASAIYIFNDYHDIEEDKHHPKKRYRPLASGQVSKQLAIVIMTGLLCAGVGLAAVTTVKVAYIFLMYILINIAYTFYLKHIPIADVSTIAIGFILRLFVGATVTDTHLSMWIVIMTFLLALFLALAKRRDDVVIYLESGKKNAKGYGWL